MWIVNFSLLLLTTVVSCKSQIFEPKIILVNVQGTDRAGYAKVIDKIDSLRPRVVSIDLQFSEYTEYEKDTRLFQALDNCDNLVMISVIEDYTGEAEEYVRFTYGSQPIFLMNAVTGFGNTILEQDELLTLKRFSTFEKVSGSVEYHFSIRTAMKFDSLKTIEFVNNNPRIIDIDYAGGNREFKKLKWTDFAGGKVLEDDIAGKIVMIGFLGPGDIDKFFTPLNTKKERPDMYGIECLANIVAQVLED
ncbi:MAG: CHASE2 domain-containing protein [Bacteroidota bacterium]